MFCHLYRAGLLALAAEQMHEGNLTQRVHQGQGMRQGLGYGEQVMDLLQGLVWVATTPEGLCCNA